METFPFLSTIFPLFMHSRLYILPHFPTLSCLGRKKTGAAKAAPVKEAVLPKENLPVKANVAATVKENNAPKSAKAIKIQAPAKAAAQPKEKIAVDMVDLVQEAEKNLYGKKEVEP